MLCHAFHRFAREDLQRGRTLERGKRKSKFDEDPDDRRLPTHNLWTEPKQRAPKEIERGWHYYEMGKTKGIWPNGWYWFDGRSRKSQRKNQETQKQPALSSIPELEAQVARMAVSGSASSTDSKS